MGSIDYWREFFRAANSGIVDVIEGAILVAASDCPEELRRRRDRITEQLYACRLTRCHDCDRAELVEEEDKGRCKKESKAGSSNCSYNEAEALTEEIEEESQTLAEVLRIKELITNHQDESDNAMFDSLRRLQLMDLSVETLQATDIGRAVNGLRKHSSKQIRQLVRTLIEDWKNLVDAWVSATVAISITDDSPDSGSPPEMDQEEGLPSPPLDEGAFFLAPQTTSIQLSEFFDGMDDDGNIRISDGFDENLKEGNGHTKSLETVKQQQCPEDKRQMRRKEQFIRQAKTLEEGIYKGEMRRQEPASRQTNPPCIEKEDMRQGSIVRETKSQAAPNRQVMPHRIGHAQSKHTTADSGPERPLKLSQEKKTSCEMNVGAQTKSHSSYDKQSGHAMTDCLPGRPQKQSADRRTSEINAGLQKKTSSSIQDKLKSFEDSLLLMKLEAAKRKLQDNYQQAQNAKKQRTIQVMELQDIPKSRHIIRHAALKHNSNFRNRLNGRF